MRTIQLYDGKWYRLGNTQLHECCNPKCCLVHRVDHKLDRGMIFERWTVDKRETAKARKARK
jgi:folate-dependent phosphoribosylglycinamide formyltransferase PurN